MQLFLKKSIPTIIKQNFGISYVNDSLPLIQLLCKIIVHVIKFCFMVAALNNLFCCFLVLPGYSVKTVSSVLHRLLAAYNDDHCEVFALQNTCWLRRRSLFVNNVYGLWANKGIARYMHSYLRFLLFLVKVNRINIYALLSATSGFAYIFQGCIVTV